MLWNKLKRDLNPQNSVCKFQCEDLWRIGCDKKQKVNTLRMYTNKYGTFIWNQISFPNKTQFSITWIPRRVTRGEEGSGLPCPFQNFKKSALILKKKNSLNIFIYGLDFSFKILFQVYLGKESPKFLPAGPFFRVLQIKCLSKCPYFKKAPLPWKISGYAADSRYLVPSKQGVLYRSGNLRRKIQFYVYPQVYSQRLDYLPLQVPF